MNTPLEGVRVLDLSRLVAGNVLTTQLADFGADVIKIERPGRGDDLRHWREEGIETWWKVYGRNKRSIVLDLKNSEDLEKLKALVSQSDVLVENFVPGKMEEMGLGVEVLQDHLTMAAAVVVVLIMPERIRIIKLALMLVMVWSSLLLTTLLCHGLQHQKIQA